MDGKQNSVFLRSVDHILELPAVQGYRLFTDNVFTGFHRLDAHIPVLIIGNRHSHQVNLGIVEHLLKGAVSVKPLFLRQQVSAGKNVVHSQKVNFLHGFKLLSMPAPHAAIPNDNSAAFCNHCVIPTFS